MKRVALVIVAGMLSATGNPCMATAAMWGGQAQSHSQTSTNASTNSLHHMYGTIRRVEGSQLTVEARGGRMVEVDATAAIKSYRTIALTVGRAINVLGFYDAKGVLHARAIQRAKSSSAGWPPDD
jgi:hypothetical protein